MYLSGSVSDDSIAIDWIFCLKLVFSNKFDVWN